MEYCYSSEDAESLKFPSDMFLDCVRSEDSSVDAFWLDATNKYENSLPPLTGSRSLHSLTAVCSMVAIVINYLQL